MWNYIKLQRMESPMMEVLSLCSDKSNLRLVVYHLGENHVECTTVSPQEVRLFDLGDTARIIKGDARQGDHAVLVYDMGAKKVYLLDSAREVGAASAILLCVVTELLNVCVNARQSACVIPMMDEGLCDRRPQTPIANGKVRRDAHGRFVRADEELPRTDAVDEKYDFHVQESQTSVDDIPMTRTRTFFD